jgi:predicted DNA-binding mobile mystery protein A
MSAAELGTRMGVGARRVQAMETDELVGAVKLSTLRRAAEAMNCQLVYAFVPRTPLDEMVRARARTKATRRVAEVSHQMRLEDQAVDNETERFQIEELAGRLVDRRGLWTD